MIDGKNKVDDDDQVDNDTDQGTSEAESEGKYQTEESKKDDLESDESESDERYQRKVRYYLKVCKSLQKDIMMIQLILIMIKIQIMKNQMKNIIEKKEKRQFRIKSLRNL